MSLISDSALSGPLEWNATLIEGDVAQEVQIPKAEFDGDLISSGAGRFAPFPRREPVA
jgi:hypothetical protein